MTSVKAPNLAPESGMNWVLASKFITLLTKPEAERAHRVAK
jgi:hypothetical protein